MRYERDGYEVVRTGECHGGPLDGDLYTACGGVIRLDGVTMPPNPFRSHAQSGRPPVAAALSLRTGTYMWDTIRLRWEWQGWDA